MSSSLRDILESATRDEPIVSEQPRNDFLINTALILALMFVAFVGGVILGAAAS